MTPSTADAPVHEAPAVSQPSEPNLPAECVTYPNGASLRAALREAKEALPEVDTAYSPSGKVPLAGLLVFLPGAAVATAIVGAICVALCIGVGLLGGFMEGSSLSGARRAGTLAALLLLIFDLLLMFAIAGGPGYAIGWLCRVGRIRSVWLPGVTAFVAGLLLFNVLFVAWFGEVTLAPIELSFLFVPLAWPLWILGLAAGIGGAPMAAVMYVQKQKFCEKGGVYLKPVMRAWIRLDAAAEALALLAEQRYQEAMELPRVAGESKNDRKHAAQFALWSHELAGTAFAEMTVRFRGLVAAEKKGKPSEETESWLAHSAELDKLTADKIATPKGVGSLFLASRPENSAVIANKKDSRPLFGRVR